MLVSSATSVAAASALNRHPSVKAAACKMCCSGAQSHAQTQQPSVVQLVQLSIWAQRCQSTIRQSTHCRI
jgi:hypothetical protein